MHYLVFYEFAPGYLERRAAFRAEHLDYAWQAVERGELLLAGAFGDDPVDGGVLLFQADSEAVPAAFAVGDPYVKNGLVTHWRLRRWNTVVGNQATDPIRIP